MDLSLRPSEWQLLKECATRNILLTTSLFTSLASLLLLIFSVGAIQSTHFSDVAFNLAEREALSLKDPSSNTQYHSDTTTSTTNSFTSTLGRNYQPTNLFSLGMQFLLPALILSLFISCRHLFHPVINTPSSDDDWYITSTSSSSSSGFTHKTQCMSGLIVISFFSLLWCVFGVIVFIRFTKQFKLKECVLRIEEINEIDNNEGILKERDALCAGFLHVLCYIGEAVDCDLVEIGLLGFLSAVFLGACSSLCLLISLGTYIVYSYFCIFLYNCRVVLT